MSATAFDVHFIDRDYLESEMLVASLHLRPVFDASSYISSVLINLSDRSPDKVRPWHRNSHASTIILSWTLLKPCHACHVNNVPKARKKKEKKIKKKAGVHLPLSMAKPRRENRAQLEGFYLL